MYKAKDQKLPLGPMQAAIADGPGAMIEARMMHARAWMQRQGIKTLDKRASWDDVHPIEAPQS